MHRIYIKRQDYKNAYTSLWAAKHYSDSLSRVRVFLSAANAQNRYLQKSYFEKQLLVKSQRRLIAALVFSALLFIALIITAFSYNKRRLIDNQGRMALALDSMKEQLQSIKEEKEGLRKEKTKAKFSFLAKLFEDVYHLSKDEGPVSQERLYDIIKNRVKLLDKNQEAQLEFEDILNKESDDIMLSFRKDYPGLSHDEYRLASYIFAGFDNTTIMLILKINNLEYTRVKKNRLKKTIFHGPLDVNKSRYLEYFNSKKA